MQRAPVDEAQMAEAKATRSKTGCVSCRSRRIKCDEKKPVCGRCSRLSLDCSPPEPPVPLKLRRRGCGSIKSRAAWDFPRILPDVRFESLVTPPGDLDAKTSSASSSEIQAGQGASSGSGISPIVLENHVGVSTNIRQVGNEVVPDVAWQADLLPALSPSQPGYLFDGTFALMLPNPSEGLEPHFNGDDFWLDSPLSFLPHQPAQSPDRDPQSRLLADNAAAQNTATSQTASNTPLHPLASLKSIQRFSGPCHVDLPASYLVYDLPDALDLGNCEKRALEHYRGHFSDRVTLKGFSWSAYSIYLGTAIGEEMVLHLILAVSLRGLSHHTQDKSLWQSGRDHLQKGLQLLSRNITQETPNHLTVMTSFWLLIIFTMDNDVSVTGVQRRDLCAKIYSYTRAHQLHGLGSPCSEGLASQSLIFKLLSMIVYANAQLNFNAQGSLLSQFFFEGDRMHNVRQWSRNYLELNHGQEYPISELMYDIEIAECFDVYYEQHRMYHLLNQVFWFGIGDYDSLGREIKALENKYSSFFRIAHRDADDSPYSRLHFHIDAAACEFYAIRLYHFRCQNDLLPDCRIQDSVSSFLQIAHRLQCMKVRYSWFGRSLFLAGIETHDTIHREWIRGRIVQDDLKKALLRVWKSEKMYGRRLRQEEMRDILRLEGEAYGEVKTN